MPYQQNIPAASDQLSKSQADIQGNFQEIYSLVGVNHVIFDAVGAGKHNIVTMPAQVAITPTLANEVSLFSQTSAITALPEMALQKSSGGTITEFTSAGPLILGWFRTPSNILVKWGTGSGTGVSVITYPVIDGGGQAIPAFASPPINFQVSPIGIADVMVYVTSSTALALTVYCSQRTAVAPNFAVFYYLAIGV
jgi:hypothetical protein